MPRNVVVHEHVKPARNRKMEGALWRGKPWRASTLVSVLESRAQSGGIAPAATTSRELSDDPHEKLPSAAAACTASCEPEGFAEAHQDEAAVLREPFREAEGPSRRIVTRMGTAPALL